ncbi:MAG: topoisomerase C-terminal repeat-containing protein, partial [Streptosporangiaceae bacterium]
LAEAKDLFSQPKARARARAAAPPLRELGDDPDSGKPMVLKNGRFGPYVTDGETNASLRKGDEVAAITDQRAAELLADRRAAPPTTRRKTTTTRKKAATPARSGSKRS